MHPETVADFGLSRTAIDGAIRLLVPSGRRAEIRALFQWRVSWPAIQHWRAGRAGPPQWAVDILLDRAAPLLALRAGPGKAAGKRNLRIGGPGRKKKSAPT
jgi:hypothetical protein